ncbi:MAG: polysaccharide pyruvyl transferase family protein [Clostridia bacterium]|nr:polysaccharide pyruvyl transferase family protein [Clostridia bacterium]
MSSIKILTFHRAVNYGAILQTYALEKTLTKLGYNANVLDYRDNDIELPFKINNYKGMPFNKKIKKLIKNLIFYKKIKQRNSEFEKFINQNLRITESVNNEAEILKMEQSGDVYITGSDQVWNTSITKGLSDIYTLNFKSSNKKISYAASVGNIGYIEENVSEFKNKISQIDKISVREDDARETLEKLLDKDVVTTLDPTLLLSKDDWQELVKEKQYTEKEKYIFSYFVTKDEEEIKIVNYLSKKTGLRIIHTELINPGYKNVIKTIFNSGPINFLVNIKNAEYVVTTSFHATVFSIIFNKNFFVIPHKKTGARVTNLLKKLGLQDRIFSSLEDFSKYNYNEDIDWNSAEEKLNKEKEKSIYWLKEAIEK